MNPRKRQASDTLPIRRHKQPRLTLKGYSGDKPSPTEKEGLLSRWNRFRMDFVALSADTLTVIFSKITLREPSNPREAESLDSSSSLSPSTPQQISSPAISPLLNGSTGSHNSRPSRTVSPPCNATTPRRQLLVQPTTPSPNGITFSTTSSNSHPSPDSHIPSSRKSSIALKRGSSGHYNRNRPHIHEKVHKAKVQRERLELREDLKNEYRSKRRTGNYISSWTDFLGYKDYEKTLQGIDLDTVSHPPRSFVLPTDDLYSADNSGKVPKLLPGDPKLKSAAHSAWRSIEQPQNPVQRALDNATATLNSPRPAKPYIPNLDQLQVSHRTRDDEIERRIRPVISLPSCLPPADDAKVTALLSQDGVISKVAREQVSDQDISRLLPGQWLNDEVINFYGAMILARSEGSKENPGSQRNGKTTKKATFLDVHYFSSFFWSKLTKEGYEKGRLAKWTKKVDIFNKDIILIPVNHSNSHWTAAAINFKEKRVESYDSMGIAKEKIFTHLRSYINSEHMNKKKKPFDFTDWKNWAPDTTPQQENGFDCGVFTCQFLETLSRGESFGFSQKNMPYLRRRMIWEIGNATLRDDHN